MQASQPNAATVIFRAALEKKVGLPNYSSFGARFDVEVVTDLGILASPEKLDNLRAQMYCVCLDAVETQIRLQKPHAEPAQVSAAPAPAPANQTSPFGAWIKAKSESYGISLSLLVNALYKIVFPSGTSAEYKQQGKELASQWLASNGTAEAKFEQFLTRAFETLDNSVA